MKSAFQRGPASIDGGLRWLRDEFQRATTTTTSKCYMDLCVGRLAREGDRPSSVVSLRFEPLPKTSRSPISHSLPPLPLQPCGCALSLTTHLATLYRLYTAL